MASIKPDNVSHRRPGQAIEFACGGFPPRPVWEVSGTDNPATTITPIGVDGRKARLQIANDEENEELFIICNGQTGSGNDIKLISAEATVNVDIVSHRPTEQRRTLSLPDRLWIENNWTGLLPPVFCWLGAWVFMFIVSAFMVWNAKHNTAFLDLVPNAKLGNQMSEYGFWIQPAGWAFLFGLLTVVVLSLVYLFSWNREEKDREYLSRRGFTSTFFRMPFVKNGLCAVVTLVIWGLLWGEVVNQAITGWLPAYPYVRIALYVVIAIVVLKFVVPKITAMFKR